MMHQAQMIHQAQMMHQAQKGRRAPVMMSYVVECAVPGRAWPPLTPLVAPPGMPFPLDEGGREAGRVGATEVSDAADAAEEGGRIASPLEACTYPWMFRAASSGSASWAESG